MDARITKARLANLLSYDWIKIIVAIVFAVLALVVFFTTVKTRPGRIHTFTVYGYEGIYSNSGALNIEDEMMTSGVFSYDVLLTEVEAFGEDEYSEQAYTARRSSGAGTVMFTTYTAQEGEESRLQQVAGGRMTEIALDAELYFSDCENYLKRFFGEEYVTGRLDRSEAERCFLKRNGKDKRYRFSEAKRAQGLEDECARLEKLRADYLAVKGYFESGKLSYAYLTDESGAERAGAVKVDAIAGLKRLVYRYEGEERTVTTDGMCMLFFRNDRDAGKPAAEVENDLRYEAVSFLRYLVERYEV